MNASTSVDHSIENTRISMQKMELAARNVDKALCLDNSAPRLIDLMSVSAQTGTTASGLTDHDYPVLNGLPLALNNMTQIKTINNVPLPPEIMDHFSRVQCHCMMGLFADINRAWLVVDSDIYVWSYEENSDLAYFDGINETIICVGLVKPKPGVFHSFIKYLLVLATSVDIVVLGVTFSQASSTSPREIQLIPDAVFMIPTDGATISVIAGSENGRLFLGSKEGNLFEISYQAESGWFGKRCKKTNLSTSTLSFLVPSFLNAALTDEDGILQISIDDTRNILYTLTEKGCIEVCDLGEKGNTFSRIVKLSQSALVHQAMNTVKTLDSQNFRPIVSISAVESHESANINLVAVSQTGVRFYLSVVSLSNTQPNQRPYTLTLVHVRLPPGYSANITVRPRAVHMSHYRDRNVLMVSSVKENDVLWCISSDLFPFCQSLTEAYTTINLDGQALAVAEVKHDNKFYAFSSQEAPPLVVRQHAEPPKKYVVLTTHGVHTFSKLRPVDLLKQILKDSHGQDTEPLKSFFMIEKQDQACATSLILASLENEENMEIAEFATRAFFMFGGEPKVAPMNQTSMFSGTTMFNPNIISTPASHQYPQSMYPQSNLSMSPHQTTFEITSPFSFSSKHNGLYLYISRILKPIWNRRCTETICVDGKTVVNTSTINSDDCMKILNNLTSLHNFLISNTQLSSVCNSSTNLTLQNSMFNNTSLNITRANHTVQDAQLEERQSLDALKTFVCHCCQVLGLWRILCEHQFNLLIEALPENQQQILLSTTFKDLFLYRQDICSHLISTLVNSYLADNACVDAISTRLREVCPLLYKSEDAAFSKANEILKTTRSMQNIDEKEEMLASALRLCKAIAPNINLSEICKQFISLKAYHAVTDLCGHCARTIDPENVALHFYKNEDNASDQEGFCFYQRRMEIYNEILNMLNTIIGEQSQACSNITFGTSFLMQAAKEETNQEVNMIAKQVISEILEYPDEIMHVALYDWMVSKQMTTDLIKIGQPSLETYLKRTTTHHPENIPVMDLLWKYYENNNNHSAAAKILNGLASRTGNSLTLKERLTYLARAIMCMRSDKVGYAPYLGVFLRDLEDKMEVAKVQEQILDTIVNLQGSIPNATEAIAALNSGLYEISQLYENFAEPYKLLECQLAIIECAGYSDNVLVENIWQQILANELRRSSGSGNDKMGQVLTKVKYLARCYASSSNCFPLGYIVYELEMLNATLRGDKSLVPAALVSINISFEKLITIYNNINTLSINEHAWQREENEFHLSEASSELITLFLNDHESYSSVEKRKIISICQDTVAGLLSNLYSKPNSDHLVDRLRGIQARLSRL